MFKLVITDREGTELQEGDIVAVSNGRTFDFYCEFKYMEKEKAFAPFHTFSFHSVVKVSKLPKNAVLSPQEKRYKFWYCSGGGGDDRKASDYKDYLTDWRKCEHELGRCFHITRELDPIQDEEWED